MRSNLAATRRLATMRLAAGLIALAGACASTQTCGDVDGSGAVNILDSLLVARFAAGIDPFGAYELAAGDVDASGALTIVDALLIAQHAAGLAPVTCTPPPPVAGWVDVTPVTSFPPLARCEHAAAVDVARDRAVVYSGWGGTMFGLLEDVWSLDLATGGWVRLSPLGTPPPARQGHRMVADAARDRMLVLFGDTDVLTTDDRVHVLDFSGDPRGAWSVLPVTGTPPAPRLAFAASLDTARDAVIVHGGYFGSAVFDEVWMLPLSGAGAGRWQRLTQTGDIPGPLTEHTLVYDSTGGRHIAFGGTFDGFHTEDRTYELVVSGPQPVAAWRQMSPGGYPPRWRQKHDAVLDSRRRMFVMGGNADTVVVDVLDLAPGGDGIWRLLLFPGMTLPPTRVGAIGAVGASGEPYLHGGSDALTGAILGDTWRLRP